MGFITLQPLVRGFLYPLSSLPPGSAKSVPKKCFLLFLLTQHLLHSMSKHLGSGFELRICQCFLLEAGMFLLIWLEDKIRHFHQVILPENLLGSKTEMKVGTIGPSLDSERKRRANAF